MRIETARKSPNFGARRGGAKPSLIILHYTGMRTEGEALDRLCDPAAQVSAHYFIGEDGRVLQLVDDDQRAWHAGKSFWRGETDINSHSIGIEIANPGHEFGYRAFPDIQINKVIELCQLKMSAFGISAAGILAHSDIAPERKQDPGELFPWADLAAQGVGLWPDPQQMDFEAAPDVLAGDGLHALLCGYGYDLEAGEAAVFRAFHRHFYPEKFAPGASPDIPDASSAARFLALLRVQHKNC